MLIELCVGNYIISNGFVNGVDGNFKVYTESLSKSLIWIHFWNLQIGINIRFENSQMYKECNSLFNWLLGAVYVTHKGWLLII